MRATAFLLLVLAAAVNGQLLSASATFSVAANQNTAVAGTFTASSVVSNTFLTALNTLIGTSISVTSTSSTAFTLTITSTLDASFAANVTASTYLSGSGFNFGLLGSAFTTPAYFTFSGANTASAGSTVTIIITPNAALSATASGSTQLHLFAQGTATDGTNSASGSGGANANANYYGAVAASSPSGTTIAYTINLPITDSTQKYVLGTATKSNFAAGSATAADISAFVTSNNYVPIALNNVFNFVAGQQYRAGNSLYIAAQAATSFTVNSAQTFQATTSTAPATTYGTVGYSYQINGNSNSNGNVALRWTGQTSAFVGGSASATGNGAKAAWYKSTAAAASASSWVKQTSSATVDASGNVNVVAQASSFSQWTVGADNSSNGPTNTSNAAVLKAAALFVAILALLF